MEKQYAVTNFLNMVYEDVIGRAKEPLQEIEDWAAYQEHQKKVISGCLKLPELEERYAMPLTWKKEEEFRIDGIRVEKYCVDAIRNLSLCVHVLAGTEKCGRAVLFLGGHDPRGAEGVYLPSGEGEKTLGMELAKMGYLVLVPELFAFGEAKRETAKENLGAVESCSEIEPWLLNCGLNLVGIRVWEAMKTLDFAEEALGIHTFAAYGISGGGHVCNYVGVLDERIEAVILSGYPNLYRFSTLPIVHCICNYIPGQMEAGESHYVTALTAPKKLLVMNGREDPIFPIEGSNVAFPYLQQVYEKLGVPEHFSSVLFDGGHEISVSDVCSWLREHYPA